MSSSPDSPSGVDAFLQPVIIDLPTRPGYGTKGRKIGVNLNAYAVVKFPTKTVYQYDCTLGVDGSARPLIEKIWNHFRVQAAFGDAKHTVLFDGSRLAWSAYPLPFHKEGLVMTVDLDEGRPPTRSSRDNRHRVVIKYASAVPLQLLEAYLNKKCDWDPKILSCVTFIDHLLRESPSRRYTTIKRSFFDDSVRMQLTGGIEAWKGIFQSARLSNDGGTAGRGRMILNVDVATAVFWSEGNILDLACTILRVEVKSIVDAWKRDNAGKKQYPRELRRIKKVRFFCKHRKNDTGKEARIHTIEGFTERNAREIQFEWSRWENDVKKTHTTTVEKYYKMNYGITLKFPELPLIRTRKKEECYPMEICFVEKAQRYPFKLNDIQTADMIKFTVTKPHVRLHNIQENVTALGWAKDPLLKAYDMRVEDKMICSNARILPPPKIEYGKGSKGGSFVPKDGRWDLRGMKFAKIPEKPLDCWGFMIFNNARLMPEDQVKAFVRNFITIYQGHGGIVTQKDPVIMYADLAKGVSQNLFEMFKKTGNKVNKKPQMLCIILPQKSSYPYNDIKAYCDVNIGVPSQCLQSKHVQQNKPQYCSNVCMKFNAKLGGASVYLHGDDNPLYRKEPTLVIGADVSHSAPGHATTSYASMVGSTDLQGTRFCAIANTNGSRVEIINTKNMMRFVIQLLRIYKHTTTKTPQRIFYFRDGVSEGQYQEVLKSEVADIFEACRTLQAGYEPKITVTICSKRHHFRFFPAEKSMADRNGNPFPGTIVERDITHPDQYDFYLNSHNAIQGTSRPVHYHVIRDDNKMPVDVFQSFVYNNCYTYMRATNSVSLIPATYYAHLASARSRCHEPIIEPGFTVPSTTPRQPNEHGFIDSRDPRPNHDLKGMHHQMQPTMWFI